MATQRSFVIRAPTLDPGGTITNAATFYVAAAPGATGVGSAITNAYAVWIDAGAMRTDGIIVAERGSASAPAYSFISSGTQDADTGLFSPGANLAAIAAGGAEIVRWQAASTGGGWMIMDEADSSPTTTELDSLDSFSLYAKSNAIIFAYNHSGTVAYMRFPMDGSTATWTHNTTEPT